MSNPKIWLSSPHMGGAEEKYVKEAFVTNWVAPLGPNVDGLEQDLIQQCKVESAAALSSGTAALHLALVLLGVKPGDFIFCQSITFSASANPIKYLGAIPVFIDSELETWNMDPVLLEQALIDAKEKNQLPKAIIVVDLYGMPAKLDEIIKVANTFEIPVIEDAAEALGANLNGVPCGSWGKFGVLSFNGNKIITTSGGGALLSKENALVDKARYLATQARDPAPHYQHSEVGYNYRMSNVLAGIGRGQMEVLEDRVMARRNNYHRYRTYFTQINHRGFDIQFQEEPDNYFSNRWLTCILIDPEKNNGIHREDIRLLMEKNQIETRPIWKPMHQQPVFDNCISYLNGNADEIFENGLCLPSGSNLVEADFDRIFTVFDQLFLTS